MTSRPYTGEDRQSCVVIFLDVFIHEPWNYRWMRADKVTRYFKDLERTPWFSGRMFVEDNHIVGFCFGVMSDYFMGKSFEIKEIIVSRAFQRRGAGGEMLKMLEAHLKAEGAEVVTLSTQREIPAFGFYQKHGYQVAEGAVYMSKSLLEDDV